MHIAMISGEYPPRWGGMGTTVYHLSSRLAEMGHKISVITRRSPGEAPKVDNVEIIQVPWVKIPMAFTRSFGRTSLKALMKKHTKEKVDVVHLHCPMASWDESQFEKCQREVAPVVASMHGTWKGERDGLMLAARYGEPAVWSNPNDIAIRYLAGRYSKFENSAIRKATVIVPNSAATMEDLLKRYDAPEQWDCQVVHWGVDTHMFSPLHGDSEDEVHRNRQIRKKYSIPNDAVLILAVGRLAARKGHGMLIRAFSMVLEKASAHLVIIGRGSLKGRLTRLATNLGIDNKISIESSMDFQSIAEMYRHADLVAYPSYYEGQGLIPLEAMASSTPVVTVNHGPLPEMVDQSVGALYEMGSEDSLSETILSEISSKLNLVEKGSNGRKRVLSDFNLDGNAKDFLKIYERALDSTK